MPKNISDMRDAIHVSWKHIILDEYVYACPLHILVVAHVS